MNTHRRWFLAGVGAAVGVVVAAAALVVGSAARAQQQQQKPFTDVPANHWAADAVKKLGAAGILKGYPQGAQTYNGNKPVTRYELAVTLWRFVEYMERADRQKRGNTRVQAPPKNGQEAVRRLVAGGYLPKDTPLAKEGDKLITANQLADALSQVMVKATEKKTPLTPDSKYAPIERPAEAPKL